MPIYRKRPEQVHAEVYRPGLEDGFGYVPSNRVGFAVVHDGSGRLVMPDTKRDGPLVPLLLTPAGYKQILEGDYVITTVAEGKRDTCSPDIFALLYEPAE